MCPDCTAWPVFGWTQGRGLARLRISGRRPSPDGATWTTMRIAAPISAGSSETSARSARTPPDDAPITITRMAGLGIRQERAARRVVPVCERAMIGRLATRPGDKEVAYLSCRALTCVPRHAACGNDHPGLACKLCDRPSDVPDAARKLDQGWN